MPERNCKKERSCKKCFHYKACKEVASHNGYSDIYYTESQCKNFTPAEDVIKVTRCKDCKLSSEPKATSRYDLYCNNYDVYYCKKEQKIICGTHFCSYGEKSDT